MPSNLNHRKFKKKRRSCAMCKPHKMHWADKRTMAERRADEAAAIQLKLTEDQ